MLLGVFGPKALHIGGRRFGIIDSCNFGHSKVTSPKLLEVFTLESISEAMKAYIQTHPFDSGDPDCKTVLDQLYRAYSESHENDPPEIQAVFAELETYLEKLPLSNNNAVFNLCCRLCIHYERKAFLDGLLNGAALIMELISNRNGLQRYNLRLLCCY